MWNEPQRGRERKKERLIFLHFLHNFLSISSLKTLVCRMCRVCFPWTGGSGTCQNKKIYICEKERGRITLPLPFALQYRKMELLPRKPHRLVFSLFIPEFPEHRATITTRILWPHTLTLRGKKKQMLLAAKCICLFSDLNHAWFVFMWNSQWQAGPGVRLCRNISTVGWSSQPAHS